MKSLIHRFDNWRIKRAIKKAEKLRKLTRKRYLVVKFSRRLKVFSRTELKELIKRRCFKKGVDIQNIENAAIYKTY